MHPPHLFHALSPAFDTVLLSSIFREPTELSAQETKLSRGKIITESFKELYCLLISFQHISDLIASSPVLLFKYGDVALYPSTSEDLPNDSSICLPFMIVLVALT